MGISLPGTLVRTGEDRATLVRRTYGLVFGSIVVTAIGVAFGFSQPALMQAVLQHPIISVVALFAPLWMAMSAQREFPRNLILTLVFTFVVGVWLAPFLSMAEQRAPGVITQSALLTFSTFGVLTLYTVVSKRDFSAWGSFFIVGVWVLLATSVLNLFIGSAIGAMWLAAGGVLVFSGLLVFDTWRIVRSGEYGPEDFVPAALRIYLDLLNIFIRIVALLSGGRRRD